MHTRAQQILALSCLTVLVGSLAILGGYTAPQSGAPADDDRRQACAEPVVPDGETPRSQKASDITEDWQRATHTSGVDGLERAELAIEAEVRKIVSTSGTPPKQRVELVVCEVLDGETEVGAVITVAKTGDESRHVVGDPFYGVGEHYMLFLEPATHDTWQLAGSAARHLVLGDGTTQAVTTQSLSQ